MPANYSGDLSNIPTTVYKRKEEPGLWPQKDNQKEQTLHSRNNVFLIGRGGKQNPPPQMTASWDQSRDCVRPWARLSGYSTNDGDFAHSNRKTLSGTMRIRSLHYAQGRRLFPKLLPCIPLYTNSAEAGQKQEGPRNTQGTNSMSCPPQQ